MSLTTPAMIRRLQQIGDRETVAILERIYADEIGHVEIGTRWYRHLCRERGLEPAATFRSLLAEYHMDRVKPPVNTDGRARAGFDTAELEMLKAMAAGHDR